MEETHFIDMMRAVQPHVSGRPRRSVELLLQSADLLRSIQQYREPELSACDASQDSVDFEALLTDLQGVCNPAEAELVNLILNFFRSKKIYSAYRMASQQNQERKEAFSQSGQRNTSADLHTESSMPDMVRMESAENSSMPNEPPCQKPPSTFRNLMENQAIQSLLSPAQKEHLNQIGTLMQAIS